MRPSHKDTSADYPMIIAITLGASFVAISASRLLPAGNESVIVGLSALAASLYVRQRRVLRETDRDQSQNGSSEAHGAKGAGR
jgi:membrane protein implicated in regulation of membrane protease activity